MFSPGLLTGELSLADLNGLRPQDSARLVATRLVWQAGTHSGDGQFTQRALTVMRMLPWDTELTSRRADRLLGLLREHGYIVTKHGHRLWFTPKALQLR